MQCEKCGTTSDLTKDHIIPKWMYKKAHIFGFKKNRGKENIQVLCHKCNNEKGGFVDCSTEIGREFWTKVRDIINKELEK